MANISNQNELNRVLSALGEQLAMVEACTDLIVIGGSALLALGYLDRPTLDVDVLALGSEAGLISPEPFSESLISSVHKVADDFGLDRNWLNPGPAELLVLGLPEGFESRLVDRPFGDFLIVRFASRVDQIHFKLYALVDQGPGRHEADLVALEPSVQELLMAGRWTITQDGSESFRDILVEALGHLGLNDADQRI